MTVQPKCLELTSTARELDRYRSGYRMAQAEDSIKALYYVQELAA
jgi:hypothetical protein